eukprot:5277367-Ditylum_brightwellii.AAC.1
MALIFQILAKDDKKLYPIDRSDHYIGDFVCTTAFFSGNVARLHYLHSLHRQKEKELSAKSPLSTGEDIMETADMEDSVAIVYVVLVEETMEINIQL